MINEIPICACDEVYRTGAHHPECPVLREIETLRQRVSELEEGRTAVIELMHASLGVYGLHLNGDNAPWESLKPGGQFEDWLLPLFPDAAANLSTQTK